MRDIAPVLLYGRPDRRLVGPEEDSMAAKIALELTELPPTLSIERAAKLLARLSWLADEP